MASSPQTWLEVVQKKNPRTPLYQHTENETIQRPFFSTMLD